MQLFNQPIMRQQSITSCRYRSRASVHIIHQNISLIIWTAKFCRSSIVYISVYCQGSSTDPGSCILSLFPFPSLCHSSVCVEDVAHLFPAAVEEHMCISFPQITTPHLNLVRHTLLCQVDIHPLYLRTGTLETAVKPDIYLDSISPIDHRQLTSMIS